MKPETLQAMHWWLDGEQIQYKACSVEWENFNGITETAAVVFSDAAEYRLKPRTIMIGDMEVPAPETEEPEIDTPYYFPHIGAGYTTAYKSSLWEAALIDKRRLAHKIVHLTGHNAAQHAKALIKISGGTI